MIFLLNFLYLVLVVVVFKKPLSAVGSPYYITHSIWDFSVIFGYFLIILIYGSEANNTDYLLRDLLTKIQIDCNEAVILAHGDNVFEKNGDVHIIIKTKDG